MSLPRFLWALALFLIIAALLPGRAGMMLGVLVALGAVLFSPGLPGFIQTTVGGSEGGSP